MHDLYWFTLMFKSSFGTLELSISCSSFEYFLTLWPPKHYFYSYDLCKLWVQHALYCVFSLNMKLAISPRFLSLRSRSYTWICEDWLPVWIRVTALLATRGVFMLMSPTDMLKYAPLHWHINCHQPSPSSACLSPFPNFTLLSHS